MCYLADYSNKWLPITCSPDRPVSLVSASSSVKVMIMCSYRDEVKDPYLEFPAERVSSHDFAFKTLLLGKSIFLSAAGVAGVWKPKGWASWTGSAAGSQQSWLTSELSVLSTSSQLKRHYEPSFLKEDEFCLSQKPPWNHSSYQATKKSSAFLLTLNIIWSCTFRLELIILQKGEVHW